MSEFDSGSGSGRKGFVRDVMRRISVVRAAAGRRAGARSPAAATADEIEELQDAMRFFGSDSAEFRRRLDRVLAEFEPLRRRYERAAPAASTTPSARTRSSCSALQDAKQQIELLKEEVDKLCAPPNTYGVFTRAQQGRHLRDPRRRQARCA